MRQLLWLLSLTLFVVLASSFFPDPNWHTDPFASRSESPVATSTARSSNLAPVRESPVISDIGELDVEEAPPAPEGIPHPEKPKPTPVLKSEPQQSEASLATQIEAEVLRLTYIERAKLGLTELANSSLLASIGRSHSADMLSRDFFSHDNLDGCSSSCRATNGGYKWRIVGENIFMMSGWDLSPQEAAVMIVNGWLSSPGHKANMLKPEYTESGTGIVIDIDDDAVYATALYGKPR
jgi:uncharacterized protein YkwD